MKPAHVTATALGKHLGISRQRVSALADEGVFRKLPGDLFDQDACRLSYIAWLRDAKRDTAASTAQASVAKARAAEIELRTAKARGSLISIETIEASLDQILGTFRAELAGVPVAASRDLAVRADIERVVNATIERCRLKLEELAAAARAGGALDVDGDEGGP